MNDNRIFTNLDVDTLVDCAIANARILQRVAVVTARQRFADSLRRRIYDELRPCGLHEWVQFFAYGSSPCGRGFDLVLVSSEFEVARGPAQYGLWPNEWIDGVFRCRLMPPRAATLLPAAPSR